MKFTISTIYLIGLTLCYEASVVVSQQSDLPCLASVDDTIDYYPIKVTPTVSQKWDVQYYKYYKIVTNKDVGEMYLLHQCGTTVPTVINETSGQPYQFAATISIPVQNIGIDQTPTIPFLEHLGLEEQIVAFTSDPAYVSSPCFNESINNGDVVALATPTELQDFASAPETSANTLNKLRNVVAFISPYSSDPPFNVTVKVSENTELTNAAIFEWIKYYSVFFNLEDKGNQLFDAAQDRWDCVAVNANIVATDNPDQPVVLWAYYNYYCGGWDVGECPNYYCEYADQCSVTILSSNEGEYNELCAAVYMTIDQLAEFGKDADYWFYPADNWAEAYGLYNTTLETFKAVQSKQVYDNQASGMNGWFEQRYAEYFAVLQDFCSIVGTTKSFAMRHWFRNIFNEPIGTVGQCSDTSRANSILSLDDTECPDLTPNGQGGVTASTPPSTENSTTTSTPPSNENSTTGSAAPFTVFVGGYTLFYAIVATIINMLV